MNSTGGKKNPVDIPAVKEGMFGIFSERKKKGGGGLDLYI